MVVSFISLRPYLTVHTQKPKFGFKKVGYALNTACC